MKNEKGKLCVNSESLRVELRGEQKQGILIVSRERLKVAICDFKFNI